MKKLLRVSVGEFDVAAGRQQFAVLQPDEVRFRDTGRCAAEDSAASCRSGDRLRPLQKLWRSFTKADKGRVLICLCMYQFTHHEEIYSSPLKQTGQKMDGFVISVCCFVMTVRQH